MSSSCMLFSKNLCGAESREISRASRDQKSGGLRERDPSKSLKGFRPEPVTN